MRPASPPSSSPPITPDALRLSQALDRSEALGLLRRRLQGSDARFEAIRPLLPAALVAHVRPGPLDETGWSLLAENGAVAAKLRQWVPRIEQQLTDHGYPPLAVRVKHGAVR